MPIWGDEEEVDWGAVEEEVKAPEVAPAAGGEKKEGDAAAPAEGAAPGEVPEDPDAIDTKKFNKHWVRPKFLQYSYLYDYRRNYYDDVIDYMDRRSHGIQREIPRPQTWAERVLRTYNQKLGTSDTATKTKTDDELIHNIKRTELLHDFHSKSYYHKVFRITY